MRKREDDAVRWDVWLPKDLAARVDLLLLDPVRLKPRYGARPQLITDLLTEWVRKQEERNKR